MVPRVIDKALERNVSLENYKLLKNLPSPNEKLMEKVILGRNQRNYEKVTKDSIESFELSQKKCQQKIYRSIITGIERISGKRSERKGLQSFVD